jgi:hypothetical protein
VSGASFGEANVESIAKECAVTINARDRQAVWQAQLDFCSEQALHLGLATGAWEEEGIVGGRPLCVVEAALLR